ncbi:MAG: DNA polymerase domain-containing protein [Kiritimatiellia bacterium]|nr:DNA polymerase domain-containing protein [Kiritimatiellia bacterium]MDP6848855.1 DNA polymerase domain-containing protein [Kiritimatiellia bacterium]
MTAVDSRQYDEMLYGAGADEGLVSAEHVSGRAGDKMVLFFRRDGKTVEEKEPFLSFIVADKRVLAECPVECEATDLAGPARLNCLARFSTWKDCTRAKSWLAKHTGLSVSAPGAPYLFFNDPVQQHLVATGRTHFTDLKFEDLGRMQVDIECFTAAGYDFCNADREEDRIIAIAMSDQTGWSEVLSGAELSEDELLRRFVETVRERDPDVIEGHNIYNFDLPYIVKRAAMCGVKLAIGRNGSVPKRRPSRVSFGERTIPYQRFEVFGRHIVDTFFLVQAYDISHRSLSGFGLKEVAIHFGFASDDREYVEGHEISREFEKNPDRIMKYCRDDVEETRAISNLLSRSSFIQAQMLPYSYQNVCVRGNATKIDSLMVREYLRRGQSIPSPEMGRAFAGGYTDMFIQGVVKNVHHCDVRSLYPSLMLTRGLGPAGDELGVFLTLLERLKDFRLDAKGKMQESKDDADRVYYDALQSTFKILINSFYGYLGFGQAHFSDFDAAERIASDGRELLQFMIDWMRDRDASPIEIDTDGIYFIPPGGGAKKVDAFRKEFAAALPEGIEIEFDGEYKAMYSYKMKNYALLMESGEVIIKGAALKSRGLEPFQRDFLKELLRLKLESREDEAYDRKLSYEKAMRDGDWPISRFAKTERLQDSPATYQAKIRDSKRARSAAYELALNSERDYRAGDQVTYYVTGAKKSVAVYEHARLVTDWDPDNRDENIPYYLAKLDALCKKFGVEPTAQTELAL